MAKNIQIVKKEATIKVIDPIVKIGLGRTTVKPTNLKPPKTK